MGLVNTRDKKHPMCTMKYTAVFFMLWAYISAGGPDILKEWSLISCQVFSNPRHYRRTLNAVKLANGGFKKY